MGPSLQVLPKLITAFAADKIGNVQGQGPSSSMTCRARIADSLLPLNLLYVSVSAASFLGNGPQPSSFTEEFGNVQGQGPSSSMACRARIADSLLPLNLLFVSVSSASFFRKWGPSLQVLPKSIVAFAADKIGNVQGQGPLKFNGVPCANR